MQIMETFDNLRKKNIKIVITQGDNTVIFGGTFFQVLKICYFDYINAYMSFYCT